MIMRKTIDQLRVLLTPRDKWKLLGLVLLMTAGALAEIAGIGLLMPVVAVFTKPELMTQNAILRVYARIIGGGSEVRLLVLTCLLIILLYVCKNLLLLAVIYLQAKFSSLKECEMGMRLYSHYMRSAYPFHLKHGHVELGVMVFRAREVCLRVMLPTMSLLADALVILMLGAALLVSMPLVTLCSAGFLTVDVLAAYFLLRKTNSRLGRKHADSAMESERLSGDGLRAIREVKVGGKEDFFISRTAEAREKVARCRMLLFVAGQIPRLWLETAAMIQLLLIFIGMVLYGVSHGTILLSFSLLIAAMARMLPACSRINYNFTVIRQNMPAVNSVFEALKEPEEQPAVSPEPVAFEKTLSVEHLTFGYVPERPVIRDLTFSIPRLASVAFTGTTGSGKTTLADLILGLLTPDSGAVRADGRDIRENLASWRAKIGYVPQFIFLLDSTIRENVAFGVPAEEIDDEKVRACLRTAQIEDFVDSLPEKLSSRVGDNGIQLSGGQRQRIGIARALYRSPEILILDEATSALDNETEQAFIDAMKTLKGKLTILMIAHRLTTVAHCDMTIHLSGSAGQSGRQS